MVWGGSGGLGSQGIQLARAAGALPVAVVSDRERGEYAVGRGAIGYLDRTEFEHWGKLPPLDDRQAQKQRQDGARAFRARISELVGDKRAPSIVFEHPAEATLPTSLYVCQPGGMVVICAGTTGYSADVDLRYLWVMQKRLQGSHGTNDEQADGYNALVTSGVIDPSLGEVLSFEEILAAHYQMGEGQRVFGNRVALVGAPEPGLGACAP